MIEEKYKTFWKRFWAGWIDTLVFAPAMLIDHYIWESFGSISTLILFVWYVAYYCSFEFYSVLMHGKYGQTLGKMFTRVKVLDISEAPLSMSQAVKRDIVPIGLTVFGVITEAPKILSGVNIYDPNMPFEASFYVVMFGNMAWFLAEIITMLFSNKRRAIHDFIAGSVVIKLPQQGTPADGD